MPNNRLISTARNTSIQNAVKSLEESRSILTIFVVNPMTARLSIPPDAVAAYKETIHQRQQAEQEKLSARRKRAWEIVHQATRMLRDTFNATQVWVFGSLVHGFWFSETSDLDLAALGLGLEDHFVAIARLQDLSPEFSIDLIRMENCPPGLEKVILQQGIQL